MRPERPAEHRTWLSPEDCSLQGLAAAIEAGRDRVPAAHAVELRSGIPVYDAARVTEAAGHEIEARELLSEWTRVLMDGSGVLVVERVFTGERALDRATAVLNEIIRVESEKGAGGDHFAASGANSRVWNSHEKLCLAAPDVFAHYNKNDVVPLVSQAWLGPHYQVTAQVNVVRPGGEAQRPHRDYHMGFQTTEQLRRYPSHVHRLSPMLTLQAAVAHCDMPTESGPTKLLPFSQRYLQGYLASEREEFRAYFEEHHVQLPLRAGDMLFLNPAVFHAAGANRTRDVARMANLLQISSAYGRAMETVDRGRMAAALYPVLLEMKRSGELTPREVENVIAATAEGYPFPANLDRAPPVDGLAPPSQQDLFRQAIAREWETDRFRRELQEHADRRLSH